MYVCVCLFKISMMIRKIIRSQRRHLHTIISQEIIKPSSPTPSHLQTYNLSDLDQCAPHIYMPLILFYPNTLNCSLKADEKVRVLKKSLSQTLTRYYPFAGRLHTPTIPYIDCNDQGVVFVEAKYDRELDNFQHVNEDNEAVGQLFADGMVWQNNARSTNLVGVQLNHFSCGGIAVAVSMSHKIGDACTLSSYMRHWASVARYGSIDHKEVSPHNPHFIHFPTNMISLQPETPGLYPKRANYVIRKFVFPNTKLNVLKDKVQVGSALGSINNPTRVELVTSLIYKTTMEAATTTSGYFRPSSLLIPVDIRKKCFPKLPQACVGNLISFMMVKTMQRNETSLSSLVSEIKKEKMELERVKSLQQASQHFGSFLSRLADEHSEDACSQPLWCSSLCGFSFNKLDFGWGKATGASIVQAYAHKTCSVLMDTPDGDGIEAHVVLEDKNMEIFENDKEMLSFCQR